MQQTERYWNPMNPQHICIFNECKYSSKWVCPECLKENINLQEQPQFTNQNDNQEFIQAYDLLLRQQMSLQPWQEIIQKKNYEKHVVLDHSHQILSVSISKNGKYLAYGGYHNQLVIYDLQLNEVYLQDRLQECMMVSSFSHDSKLLYLGCQKGQLVSYDLEKRSSQKQRMNPKQTIQNLVLKENTSVIFSIESYIFMYDMKKEILLFKIDQTSKKIFGLDYNIINDIIVTGSIDSQIMIYDGSSRKLILKYEQAHQDGILQLQILNNDRLLTKDNKQVLKQWSIDFGNRQLVFIREIRYILNFYSIRNDCILIVQKGKFQILNQNFILISEQPHENGEDVQERAIQQLKSMEYLLILGQKQLLVLKQSDLLQQNIQDRRQNTLINVGKQQLQ